jgi:hypothetical protein
VAHLLVTCLLLLPVFLVDHLTDSSLLVLPASTDLPDLTFPAFLKVAVCLLEATPDAAPLLEDLNFVLRGNCALAHKHLSTIMSVSPMSEIRQLVHPNLCKRNPFIARSIFSLLYEYLPKPTHRIFLAHAWKAGYAL